METSSCFADPPLPTGVNCASPVKGPESIEDYLTGLHPSPKVSLCLRALNLDGDVGRTQEVYSGSGLECPTSSVR